MSRTTLALMTAAVLGVPVALLGLQAGLEGWPLTLLALPVMFLASLVGRDGFYGADRHTEQ